LNKEPCKVLVVDEDRDNADTTMMLLQMWGHEAEAVYSTEDALAAATTLDPDVVLLDLGRPIVNGLDLAQELRRHCPTAKLVAITAFTAADIVPRTRDAGFEQVLFKPAPAQQIKEAVDAECATTTEEQARAT
jgi:CheY-like chemotaxis protein